MLKMSVLAGEYPDKKWIRKDQPRRVVPACLASTGRRDELYGKDIDRTVRVRVRKQPMKRTFLSCICWLRIMVGSLSNG